MSILRSDAQRRFGKMTVDDAWGKSSFMGPMTGRDWSRLQARHLDHHLCQFGV